jgi:hypothetical protein
MLLILGLLIGAISVLSIHAEKPGALFQQSYTPPTNQLQVTDAVDQPLEKGKITRIEIPFNY